MNKQLFEEWIAILCESKGRQFTGPTIVAYFKALEQMPDDVFSQVAQHIFENDERFPTVARFREVREAIAPPEVYQLPAHTPKAFVDMSSEEQAEYKRELARVRQTVKAGTVSATESGLTAIGQILAEVSP